jgi:hypothetical protein
MDSLLKKIIALFSLFLGCDTGNIPVIAEIPVIIREVSGIETSSEPENLWMVNDSGNKAELFLVNTKGKIQRVVKINAKNRDWEDLTSDAEGNIYIGDFGNNKNNRKNLAILKVSKDSLNKEATEVERISFSYEDQNKFPPKKKSMEFDCESFFFYNDSLYLFTKSRVKDNFGHTNLYKIPTKRGHHKAQLISSFKTCNDLPCWITAADISDDGKIVALLTLNAVWTFTDFKGDDFFMGEVKKYDLGFESQKESICFKDNNTLFIADESTAGVGGNLYELSLNKPD